MNRIYSRRRALQQAARWATGSVVALGGPARLALAQTTFPSQPVRVVVPFTAGGLTDVLMRGMAQELTVAWGQPVLVDNRPGANTIIGADLVAKAPADGTVLLLANDPTLSANQVLYHKLPYNPVSDFVPVINLVGTDELLVVRADFPAKTLAEFLAQAKARPGQLTYGSYGPGSKAHLDAEEIAYRTGLKFNHIPYKGVADVMTALASGQIDFSMSGVPPAIQLSRAGKIRPLALAAAKRSPQFPDTPTFNEAGLPFESRAWFGLVAPKGTPQQTVNRIAADASKVLRQPAFLERYVTGVGLSVLDQSPEVYARFLEQDRAEYAERLHRLGVTLD